MNLDNYHLTLKFLGEVEDQRTAEMSAALAAATRGFQAFDIALAGLGAFPTPTRPRVLWAGVTGGGPRLTELAGAVDDALAAIGFPPEPRAFSAHITLARVREPRRDAGLADALARAASLELGSSRVDRIVLMRSQPSPAGARYSEVSSAPLSAEISRET